MDELKELLKLAVPDTPDQADPAADLARGRRLRRRRWLVALGGGATVAAVAVAVTVTAIPDGAPASTQPRTLPSPAASAQPSGSPGQPGTHALALVSYRGRQAPGYRVSQVPRGWVVQGGDPYVLTIAPAGDKDTSYQSFVGKLVVMLQSRDVTKPPSRGKSQPVRGQPGRFEVQGGTQILTYRDPGKRWMVIQAPVSLGWDSGRLAEFAAGVKILGNAQPGRG